MPFITYIAKERVIGTHTVGVTYNKDFDCNVLDFKIESDIVTAIAVSKKEESTIIGDEDFWSISVTNIAQADLAEWEEIFMSIRDRTNFTFDPYGTFTSQVSPDVYILKTKAFAPKRVAHETFNLSLLFKKEL